MSDGQKCEEKYPLLYLIVDKEESPSKNNKKFFDRRPAIGIGTTRILEQWPGFLSICWLSTLISVLAAACVLLIIISLISSLRFHRIPRCVKGSNQLLDNGTIHLVHGPTGWKLDQLQLIEKVIQNFPNNKVHLILIRKPFVTSFLEKMSPENVVTGKTTEKHNGPSRKLLGITKSMNDTNAAETDSVSASQTTEREFSTSLKEKYRRITRPKDDLWGFPFFDPGEFLHSFFKKRKLFFPRDLVNFISSSTTKNVPIRVRTISGLLKKYPEIIVERTSFEILFRNTPLFNYWHFLNDPSKVFAVRVIQLWQYGGLSFDLYQIQNSTQTDTTLSLNLESSTKYLQNFTEKSSNTTNLTQEESSGSSNQYIDSLVHLGYTNFQTIPGGIVTLSDNGSHMETKTACHSFFGEILMSLKYGNRYTTPKTVIANALKYFIV